MNNFDYQKVSLVSVTKPELQGTESNPYELIDTAEKLIAYCARVSNPANQHNHKTAGKLLKYCIKNKHWSIFEMADMTVEIVTTRDIGRQILRHRSFSFQEFSQRYAEVEQESTFFRQARLQDLDNRQNSIVTYDEALQRKMNLSQQYARRIAMQEYRYMLSLGIAKEQARCVLPEGLTLSRMYMKGSFRSWLTYFEVRCGNGTQAEHIDIANKAKQVFIPFIPSAFE